MEEAIRYTSAALAAVICAVIVRRVEPTHGTLITVFTAAVLGVAAVSVIGEAADYAVESARIFAGAEDAVAILLRVLGIAVATGFGAQVCRDCGEGALAWQLELLGGALSLVQTIPLADGVLRILRSLMNG